MEWRKLVLAFGVVVCMTVPAAAQDGFYVGIRAIGSLSDLDDVNTSGFTGAANVEHDDDAVAGLGGMVGYRWQDLPLRTEIEGSYRFRFDLDVRDGGPPTIDYETNIATTSVLFNTFVEWRNDTDFTPFIGGSIGWARHSTENDRTNLATQAKESDDADKDNLAWGAMAGVDWLFLENVSAELAYRFINLGDVDAGSFSTGDSIDADDYTSHEVLLSFSYRF